MMTTTFEEQLAKIKAQASVLENLDDRAVELGVILPLLKQLGWDTEDLTQIYPQKRVPGAGKVDYEPLVLVNIRGRIGQWSDGCVRFRPVPVHSTAPVG